MDAWHVFLPVRSSISFDTTNLPGAGEKSCFHINKVHSVENYSLNTSPDFAGFPFLPPTVALIPGLLVTVPV